MSEDTQKLLQYNITSNVLVPVHPMYDYQD